MTIIKHGQPKEDFYFICLECGCEWKASREEVEAVLTYETGSREYYMRCPDCGSHNRVEKCEG